MVEETPPTPEESEGDTIRGLTQDRREETRDPLANIPTDEGEAKRHLAEHKQVYDVTKKRGRREVLKRYKIEGAQLDAIEREGFEKKWPPGEE